MSRRRELHLSWHERGQRQESKTCWCFKCRKRSRHLLWYTVDLSGYCSYVLDWRCKLCGEDHTVFPGRE